MATAASIFRFPVRSADVWGLNDEEQRPTEDIAADLDFQDNAVEDYLLKVTGETSRGGGPKGLGLPGLPAEFAGALREGILGALLDAFDAAEADELGSADIARLLHKLDPSADWGQREAEPGRAWSSRIGARLGQEIKAACKDVGRPPVEAAKVTTLDGKEGRGYRRADLEGVITT